MRKQTSDQASCVANHPSDGYNRAKFIIKLIIGHEELSEWNMSNTVIDHAIAIPTKQRNVWEHLSDISKFPLWQVDVQSISFLSTKHNGRGARYRVTTNRGAVQVIEITAWYEGLGFEYIIVDGTPFTSNRGRIRIQESTDGTIVQWTFSYELTGFLSGLRNSLSVRRGLDNDIIDNLRNFYTYIRELRGEEKFNPEDAKSFIQEAPDVIARSMYQPRYPTKSETAVPPVSKPAPATAARGIYEPPLTEEDTKPNQAVKQEPTAATPPVAPMPEPTFLKDMPDFSKIPSAAQVKPEPLPLIEESQIETETVTAPTPPPITLESASILTTQPTMQSSQIVEPAEPAVSDAEADAIYTKPLAGLSSTSTTDSAKVSVFEVFGLPKPSETENLRTIQEEPQAASAPVIEANTEQIRTFTDKKPITPDVDPEATQRTGLRASLRRKTTRIRLPK